MPEPRLAIDPAARDLVRQHSVLVQRVAQLLGERMRDEPVRGVTVERAAGDDEGEGILFRVLYDGEVEEAQRLWERLESDLSDLQERLSPDERAGIELVSIVVDWSLA